MKSRPFILLTVLALITSCLRIPSAQAQASTCAESSEPSGKIAFISDRSGSDQIYLMDTWGESVTQLTHLTLPYVADLDWSPDGKQLAFTYGKSSDNDDIYVLDVQTLMLKPLTNAPGTEYNPAWSPDGTHIAFTSDQNGPYDIWEMRADGTELQQITDDPRWEITVRWMPDGKSVAYVPNSGADLEIWVESTTSILIPNPVEGALYAVTDFRWSPDGRRLSLETDFGAYLIDGDGKNLQAIEGESTYFDHGTPSWSPDSCQIVFASTQTGNADIYSLDLNTSARQKLTDSPADDYDPVWQPQF